MPNIVKPSGVNQLWAASGTKVAPSLQKIGIGWVVELPPYQYQNWLDNRQDTFIAHINQHGIPEWDTETEYQGNLSYTQGSNGLIYKCLVTNTNFNPTNPLNSAYWVRAFETYGSVAVVQSQLTALLNNYATLAGISNTVAARNNLSVWSKAESDARFAFKGGTSGQVFSVGAATAPAHAVPLSQLTTLLVGATESVAGQIAIATLGEVQLGQNDFKAVTPLKGATVYLKKDSNLFGLASPAIARSNLGLSDSGLYPSNTWHVRVNNFSDVLDKPLARSNLGLGTIATAAAGSYLQTANNLGDIANAATARSNLGLTSTATTALSSILLKSDNLAGLGNQAIARSNLGLNDSVLYPSNTWLVRTNNLSDLSNAQSARNNLGLADTATIGSSAFLFATNNLGDVPDKATARANLGLTIVANSDPNVFMYKSENLVGLTNTSIARNNLGLGTAATKNVIGVAGDLDYTFGGSPESGGTRLGNGMTLQWGIGPALGDDGSATVTLTWPGQIMTAQVTGIANNNGGAGPCFTVNNYTTSTFVVNNNYNTGPPTPFTWMALVLVT